MVEELLSESKTPIFMSKKFNHEDFSHWVFDLDNTLYPEDENIFPQVKKRIIEFISIEFQIDKVSANKKRKRLYDEYGTSLRGLMLENKINPRKFLEYVHDIDLSIIKKKLKLNKALQKIKGTKYIFTNGSFKHAENVLQKLGIENNFHSIHSIETSCYIPKPSKRAYEKMILKENIDTKRAIMFEDTKWNLQTAKNFGMTTVLISSKNDLLENEKNDYIDYTITDLEEFLS